MLVNFIYQKIFSVLNAFLAVKTQLNECTWTCVSKKHTTPPCLIGQDCTELFTLLAINK